MAIAEYLFSLPVQTDRRLWRGLAWSAAAAVAEVAPYALLCVVLDRVARNAAGWPLAAVTTGAFVMAFAALVVFRARANIATFAGCYAMVAEARMALADHLARLPMGLFSASRRAVIADLVGARFTLYQDVVARAWGRASADVLVPGLLFTAMAYVDWRLALIAGGFLPPALAAIGWSHRLLSRANRKLSSLRADFLAGVVDEIEGMAELRRFDHERCRLAATEALLERLEREQMRTELAPAPALLLYSLLVQAGFAVSVLAGAISAAASDIEAVDLLLFTVLGLRCQRALTELGIDLAELRFAADTLSRIRRLADEPALAEAEPRQEPDGFGIAFRDVSFEYPDGAGQAVAGISGRIEEGRTVALVGPSGAGKSTLAHLVARLWDVTEGAIEIGGADIRRIGLDRLNRAVAMVLQDVYLFEGTVADNVRLGRPQADDAAVRAACRAARADGFIERLADGYHTRLAPGAPTLSGGERQRLAIARAFLKDAPILVLDEATSNVDLDNEAEIQAALANLARGRTVIAIAHRLWTVLDVDEIWVLEDGRVVERGTAEELIRSGGVFRRMWEAQEGTGGGA